MAKAKKKKAQKGKGILEPDVMVYIYSLAAIAVSLIGCLQIGFAGSLLTSLLLQELPQAKAAWNFLVQLDLNQAKAVLADFSGNPPREYTL